MRKRQDGHFYYGEEIRNNRSKEHEETRYKRLMMQLGRMSRRDIYARWGVDLKTGLPDKTKRANANAVRKEIEIILMRREIARSPDRARILLIIIDIMTSLRE